MATNPDCAVGKHPSCSGDAWDNETDQPVPCGCTCHWVEITDSLVTPTGQRVFFGPPA